MVFGEPLQLYKQGAIANRSELPPEFRQALYRNPEKCKFSKFAPILFPKGSFGDMTKLFRCKYLALVRLFHSFCPNNRVYSSIHYYCLDAAGNPIWPVIIK